MLKANVAELARKQRGVFTWAQARVEYTNAEAQTLIAKGERVRVFRGVYRERTTPLSPGLSVEAARLSMGVDIAVACYSTAAELHGFAVVEDPVTHVLTFDERMSRSGRLSAHRDKVFPSSVATVGGTPTTCAARTAVDMARIQSRLHAIATLDRALRSGVPRSLLRGEVFRHVGERGVRQARELIELADHRANHPWSHEPGCAASMPDCRILVPSSRLDYVLRDRSAGVPESASVHRSDPPSITSA